MQWEVVIGLETHRSLTAVEDFQRLADPLRRGTNTQASPVDLALPGVLPVMNRGAVERAIQLRPGGRRNRRAAIDFCAQELLLSRFAEGLPDQPVRHARGAGRQPVVLRRKRRQAGTENVT